ncbi:MAG: CpsD/CapB family tyrosine-protein kinase [Candidatus Omnitrophica bacterium]|nr:CpsD/CapB family tyrosine-protein kinase [Candidatus Omnitrophota bacterium]MCB9746941.1 CpsD/CapB family tyrosine-protein kinase [Candidatus Omnitrophota bacterium]
MGKITNALKKAAEERIHRIEKITKIKERDQLVVRKMGKSKVDPSIITYFDPKALITEQYKMLRTNIMSLNKGRPPRIFAITSSLHSEGKTVTSINLAMVMSHAIRKPKVLLIDSDMRRGQLRRYLGVEQRVGLSEVLSGQCGLEDVMFNLDDDNLTFVLSGEVPENPAELLSSDNMSDLLKEVKTKFDYVIIDTPPMIPVTDAGIIGSQVEGVLMVIQAGRTQRGIVQRAEELIHQSQSKVIGHVLTNIEYHLPEYIYRYL